MVSHLSLMKLFKYITPVYQIYENKGKSQSTYIVTYGKHNNLYGIKNSFPDYDKLNNLESIQNVIGNMVRLGDNLKEVTNNNNVYNSLIFNTYNDAYDVIHRHKKLKSIHNITILENTKAFYFNKYPDYVIYKFNTFNRYIIKFANTLINNSFYSTMPDITPIQNFNTIHDEITYYNKLDDHFKIYTQQIAIDYDITQYTDSYIYDNTCIFHTITDIVDNIQSHSSLMREMKKNTIHNRLIKSII